MECLHDLTKRFSIIDILAFLLPGTIYLLLNFYIFGEGLRNMFFAPLTETFGENIYLKAVYFGVIAYVMGSILNEMSTIIRKGQRLLARRFFHKNVGLDIEAYNLDVKRMSVFPVDESYRKEQLFQGFELLCESLISVINLVALEYLLLKDVTWTRDTYLILLAGAFTEVLLCVRAARFERLKKYYLDVCLASLTPSVSVHCTQDSGQDT